LGRFFLKSTRWEDFFGLTSNDVTDAGLRIIVLGRLFPEEYALRQSFFWINLVIKHIIGHVIRHVIGYLIRHLIGHLIRHVIGHVIRNVIGHVNRYVNR